MARPVPTSLGCEQVRQFSGERRSRRCWSRVELAFLKDLWSLKPEGEAEQPEATVLWNAAEGLLRESCHTSLELRDDVELFSHPSFVVTDALTLVCTTSSASQITCKTKQNVHAAFVNTKGYETCSERTLFVGPIINDVQGLCVLTRTQGQPCNCHRT